MDRLVIMNVVHIDIKNVRTFFHAVLMFSILASVSGCGGGGGGGGNGGVTNSATATSSSVVTDEDTPVQGTLIASNPDNVTLTYSIVSNGKKGIATITNPSTGAFVYTPDANTTGTDSFTFKANDGVSNSNKATITVTIVAVNDPPVSMPESLTTNEDTPVSGTLMAVDADLQPLTYSIVNNGSMGNTAITNPSTGAFVYTPDPNANGTDSFSFQASDGLVNSNVSTVTITIDPVNDPPVATGTCATTPQAKTFAGTLPATDLETPNLLTYSLNTDGSGGAGPIVTSRGGTVTITDPTTGAFTYRPEDAKGGKRGKDTFTYQVRDSDGAIGSSTETIIVDQTIMPLGDSITKGTISSSFPTADKKVGYRKPLYDTLILAGFTFDFVGTQAFGSGVSNFDYNNEGHGGWTAYEIAWGLNGGYPTDGVRAWLDANPADIILLHIGTNQLNQNTDVDVASILDEIDLWESSANGNHVTVVLALIIDQDPINPDVAVYNSHLVTLANNRIADGDDIVVVNQHNALTYPDDMGDGLHPNANGYAKMSNVWFNALKNLVDKCP
jgi:VCBS repeat-containing protein